MKPLTRLFLAALEIKKDPVSTKTSLQSTKKILGSVKVQKNFRKAFFKVLTAIKLKNF